MPMRCIGGKRKQAAAGSGLDYVGVLPDALIEHVLSFLPAHEVIRSCVLSRRWRDLWRSRPPFEDEGPSVVEFPDDFTICVNTGDEYLTNPKKDYEFDRVYGPQIGQGELFHDVQPFVQSALDGHNISIFVYDQSRSGKIHTLEGSSHDRGLYLRNLEKVEEDANRDNVTKFLHVSKSLSVAKKEPVLSGSSRITQILADYLGSSSKTLLVVHVSPSASNLSRTLSVLSYSARARNDELSLGNHDTMKKWKDVANDSRKELHEKEKEVSDLREEALGLKLSRNEANGQHTLLFNKVQKAWRVSSTLQTDLKFPNISKGAAR